MSDLHIFSPSHCYYTLSRSRKAGTIGFLVLMSFLLISLSSCSSLLNNSSQTGGPVPATTTPTRVATVSVSTPVLTLTPDPLRGSEARALQIMAGMSLEQKLGQLIVVEYLGNSYTGTDLQYMVEQQYVGGVLYQSVNHNFDAPDNTMANVAALSQQIQQGAKLPLLIGTDQEGGLVNRLAVFHGPQPSAEAMAATGDPTYVKQQGTQTAKWLQELGINSDLAPVVDVHSINPPILQTRMFGSTPQDVATYAGAFLDGLQENQIAGCLKHFPGLGALLSDPHFGLPTINRSLSDLEKIDLAPYRLMISKNHPAMIMDTDVIVPAIDPTLPAELSPKTINGLLRDQLGYNGVVITDGLYMEGISKYWSLGQAAALSIIAGDDLVEGPYSASQVASVVVALKQALQNGELTQARIDQSVERILLMKLQYGILK